MNENFSNFFRGRDAPVNRTSGSAYSFFMGGSTTAVNTIRGWLRNNSDYKIDVVLSCMDHKIFDFACEELGGVNHLGIEEEGESPEAILG